MFVLLILKELFTITVYAFFSYGVSVKPLETTPLWFRDKKNTGVRSIQVTNISYIGTLLKEMFISFYTGFCLDRFHFNYNAIKLWFHYIYFIGILDIIALISSSDIIHEQTLVLKITSDCDGNNKNNNDRFNS